MSILSVHSLTQGFGDKNLYKNADFTLYKGEHAGVVGQNGVGKSTLVSLLVGRLTPDSGEIRWQPDLRLGYLDQYAETDPKQTVEATLRGAFAPLVAGQQRLEALYARAAAGDQPALAEAAALQDDLAALGLYTMDNQLMRVAGGLGLDALGLHTPLDQLSGGQRAKVLLGKLLLSGADVLLLDEPTNFLDRPHIHWLGEFLTGWKGALVVVSHDAAFLRRVSTVVLDIEFGTIRKYQCGYDTFLSQKDHLREDYLRRYSAQQRHIQRTEEYIRRNIAGVHTKNARGRRTQLERLERLAPPGFAERPSFRFAPAALSTAAGLEVKGLLVGYTTPLLPPLTFKVAGGEKLVVTGFNGIGKSTLLKTLVGQLPALGGSFRFALQARCAYFSQDLTWQNGAWTPLRVIQEADTALDRKKARAALARCGIRAQHMEQPVATLSGGEQAKVKLCGLILQAGNFLILDEPTNHMDAETREVLQQQLAAFPGCVILVSHDAAFYGGWAHRVLDIGRPGRQAGAQ